MLTLGWFSTGRGEGSLGLLRFIQEQIKNGKIEAQIQFVFSNRIAGDSEGSDRFFQQVQSYGLPLVHCSSREFRKNMGGKLADHRLEYDREVMHRLSGFNPDVCVLAGYMLIVGEEMCHRYKMLNLHPALPTGPIGTWQEVIWNLIETGEERTGAMVHLVTENVDRGPVIAYFDIPIVGGEFDVCWKDIEGKSLTSLTTLYGEELPLFRLIRQEEYRREPYLIAATLNALNKGMLKIHGDRILDFEGKPSGGLRLSDEIEEDLAAG